MSCGHKCNCNTWGDHARSVTFSASAMPTRSQSKQPLHVDMVEKSWRDDMPAYKRLRRDGLQPRTIEGSAMLEAKACDRVEVESGKLFGEKLSMVKDVKAALGETSTK